MRYYVIAGEASGDLHASRLLKALRKEDPEAEFRGFGGDEMQAAGCQLVKHYRELAYMGVWPVLTHLPQIMEGMRLARRDILAWQPQVVILVDYPGFNMKMAKFVKRHTSIPVYYYIAPKIWAWKEWRIKSVRRYVDELFSILPFEVDFFEGKHHYPIHYVGNPTADEVREYRRKEETEGQGASPTQMPRGGVVLLPGSRRQEIKDNLPAMLEAVGRLGLEGDVAIAGAPGIDEDYYRQMMAHSSVTPVVCFGQTYPLLSKARAALVTSGTATLETALLGVPQVVCYETPMPRLVAFLRRHILKVRWVSLVNLVAQREVVPELVADTFSVDNICSHLSPLLDNSSNERRAQLQGYQEVWQRLGQQAAPANAAQTMVRLLKDHKGKRKR